MFGTLGFTALLLTARRLLDGRYGETTGRDRAHAPLLSIAVITVLYSVARSCCATCSASTRPRAHIFAALVPTDPAQPARSPFPVHALDRGFSAAATAEWVTEVRLLG